MRRNSQTNRETGGRVNADALFAGDDGIEYLPFALRGERVLDGVAETFAPGSIVPQPDFIEVPTGVATFNEANRPPRALAEPFYNIQRWVEIDQGGHFPALENPEAVVEELRTFFRPLRP